MHFFPKILDSCYHFICNNEWLQTNCHIIFLNAFSFLMSHFSFQDCVSIRSKIYDPQGLFPWHSMDHVNTKPPQATSKKVKTEICTLGQCNLNKNEKGFRLQQLQYILIRLHGGAPCSKIWKKWNFREFLPHRSKSIFVYFLSIRASLKGPDLAEWRKNSKKTFI